MLRYSLSLVWDKALHKWKVDSINFSEDPGVDGEMDVTDIHTVNEAMKVVAKIIDVIDTPVEVTSIEVKPGSPEFK